MKKCRKRNPCSQRSKWRRWAVPSKEGERECVDELPAPGDGKTGPMQPLWPQVMAAWCLQQREHSALRVCCCFKQDVTSRGLFLFLPPSDSASCLCLLACEGRERKENIARGRNCFPTLSDPSPSPGHVRIFFSILEVPSTLPPFPLTQLLHLSELATQVSHLQPGPCLLPRPIQAGDRKQLRRTSKALLTSRHP